MASHCQEVWRCKLLHVPVTCSDTDSMVNIGMSLGLTCNLGTELGCLIPLVTSLRYVNHKQFELLVITVFSTILVNRAQYKPHLPKAVIPAVTACKSIKNIVCKRSWRPLYHNELKNVKHKYLVGKVDVGYQPNNNFHWCAISCNDNS